MSRVNELKIKSATGPVTVTPDTAAVITLVVRALLPPISSVLAIPLVRAQPRIYCLIVVLFKFSSSRMSYKDSHTLSKVIIMMTQVNAVSVSTKVQNLANGVAFTEIFRISR